MFRIYEENLSMALHKGKTLRLVDGAKATAV